MPDLYLRPIRAARHRRQPGPDRVHLGDAGLSPDLLCIYPHDETVLLGGTAIDGEAALDADEKAAAAVPDRCTAGEPHLAGAQGF